ncbi:MAG: YggT family protein [Treponema sp.]|nr:YggT family protein [Treponema sp.]
MRIIFGILFIATWVYSLLIFMRIVISWFSSFSASSGGYGKPVSFLTKVTDPYLNWWRARLKLRLGPLDFSVVAAIVFISFLQGIFHFIYIHGGISIRNVLVNALTSLWGVFSFIAGFCLLVIILRLFAYFTNRNMYSPFWAMVDAVSSPILFKFRKLFTSGRIISSHGDYIKTMVISGIIILAVMIGGSVFVSFLANLLRNPPS